MENREKGDRKIDVTELARRYKRGERHVVGDIINNYDRKLDVQLNKPRKFNTVEKEESLPIGGRRTQNRAKPAWG